MSTIQDMNNRIKQNRAQRPSKRPKFKENNREPIYKADKKIDLPNFKTLPKSELDKLKERIQERAALDMKKEGAILKIILVTGLVLIIVILIWLN